MTANADANADASALVELRGVTKRYRAPGAPDVEVLRGVDLRVTAGETLAIVGPSGSGKSTLLNLMGALDRCTQGEVLLDGVNLQQRSERELAAVRARDVGFVFQLHHLLPQCTVRENVLIPTLAAGPGDRSEPPADRAQRLLHRVGLGERMDFLPHRLSGGERQRAAVVRALINRPRLLLADEPTGSLDQHTSDALASLLLELNREEGVALVVVTHSLPLAGRMHRTLLLRQGRLAPPEGGA